MPYLEYEHITKTFGGTVALNDISLSIDEGEVHVLMGENGAGKSTLGKILAGIHKPDRGAIRIAGTPVHFNSPRDARNAGIGMVHQELALCPDLCVSENLALGRYPRRGGVFLDERKMAEQARRLLHEIGAEFEPTLPLRELSVGQNQIVQIAAALGMGARILVFDEPTSALSESESRRLLELIRRLRARGVTIIYVSHRMNEVLAIGDRITVLRDGLCVGTIPCSTATQDQLVEMMIGRRLRDYFPQHLNAQPGREVLQVENLSSRGKFSSVSFSVREGEILGFAGLVGAGRSEVARAVFGIDRTAEGSVRLLNTDISTSSVRARMAAGIAYVPEDRKRQGLALALSCRMNFSLTLLEIIRKFIFVDRRKETTLFREHSSSLGIKASSMEAPASGLSGGNQQKLVLAKWLARKSNVLILDEPTRGVDIGAKAAIHTLIDSLAQQGKAILLVSSELPEILHLCTRVLVMRGGRIVAEVAREEATQERIMKLMAGLA